MDIKQREPASWVSLREMDLIGEPVFVHGIRQRAVLAHLLARVRDIRVIGQLVRPEPWRGGPVVLRKRVLGGQVQRGEVQKHEIPRSDLV